MRSNLSFIVIESENPTQIRLVFPKETDNMKEIFKDISASTSGQKLRLTLIKLDYSENNVVNSCESKIVSFPQKSVPPEDGVKLG